MNSGVILSGTPLAEVEIDQELVRALLRDQHSDLAELPIEHMDAGWDNVIFRLGGELAVRMPRRQQSVPLIGNEQDWLPALAPKLPLPIPSPLRIGQPGRSYPWKWSILPWLSGQPANDAPPHSNQAPILAKFLRALHQLAPANAPENEFRGCPLAQRAEAVSLRLVELNATTRSIVPAIEVAWQAALDAPVADQACWLHGDLHARNVLVDGGAISAVIDWGDITSGDVATDLASVWALFDNADARRNALQSYGATEPEIARARGWAINFGSILLATGLADNPLHAVMGLATLRRVAEDLASF